MTDDIRVVGDRELADSLRRAGLNARALAAWAGTDRIAALPSLLPRLVAMEPTPAAAVLRLFVGGARVPRTKLGLLGDSLPVLARRGLVELDGDDARAPFAILPLGSSLLVCDRLDAPPSPDLVCWPDDSSQHLAACVPPGRRERWLDLGCGSAFAPLARPELAAAICGTDSNARALQHAKLGAALSGVPLIVFTGDVGATVPAHWRGACELVTCNAPIPALADDRRGVPDAPDAPVWRHAAADVVSRMLDAAASFAAPNATIVIHAAEDELARGLEPMRGDRVIVTYTPEDMRGFAVAWWRPDGKMHLDRRRRLLTPEAPHLTFADFAQH